MSYREDLKERIKIAEFAVRFTGWGYNKGRLSAFRKALELYEDQDEKSTVPETRKTLE